MRFILKNRNIVTAFFLVLIIILSFIVRFYNFHDWLYFKMDQSRDAALIGNAIKNGPEYLPLLGPRAGATEVSAGYLRLGPAFYYFQYLSGKIFNSINPDVFAYPDLFFSIVTILLLYAFLRLYFSRSHSLLITAMYSFSFLVIQYSRFAWNPNSLLFFTLLSFYGLLRFLNSPPSRRRFWWLILWITGFAIGSQLHFLGLFCLMGISAIVLFLHFELWKKSEIVKAVSRGNLKKVGGYFAIGVLTFAILYTPVIISDVIKKGENTKNFIQAFSTKPNKKSLGTKIGRSVNKQLKYYCLITTSGCYQGKIEKNVPLGIATAAFLIAGLYAAAQALRKKLSLNQVQKDFLRLALIWFGMFFIFAIPVYSSLRPRFFIFVFPLPFIFLGFIYQLIEEKLKSNGKYIALAITVVILAANAYGTKAWFQEQAKSQTKNFTVQRTLILKNQDGVTLGQLERAANFMYKHRRPGATIYYYVKPEHVMPIKYLLYQKNDPSLRYEPLKKINEDPAAQYFAVAPTKNGTKNISEKYGDNFKIIDSQKLGQISIYEFEFTNRVTYGDFKFNKESSPTDRLFWKDVFGIKGNDASAIQIEGNE
ncbi:MAG: phospholipid carrier-dependent glycosyltransferase [Patescibacteria group bacterium]